MKRALVPLVEELAVWRDLGETLPVWWRDDDATQPTPALDRLLGIAGRFGAPLHLAVVPEPAVPALAERIAAQSEVYALPHGWAHQNHAPKGKPKAEFGRHRPAALMLNEIGRGFDRIRELFGERALPVFVPPWNRVSSRLFPALSKLGFSVVSTWKARKAAQAAPGLARVNVHVDPIAWRRGRGLVDPAFLARKTARQLERRRLGIWDKAEPYGLMTHHLVHDEAIWAFTEAYLEVLAESGVARWTSPA